MKGYCPNCECEATLRSFRRKETVQVRGEDIPVVAEFSSCRDCGEEFQNTRGVDHLDTAYREYRKRHGMLQPEEIKDWRNKFGLTQREVAEILGLGGATLSRYENGALQDTSHERMLRLAIEPRNLIKLLEASPDAIPQAKREKLIRELGLMESESCSLDKAFELFLGNYPVSEMSGYRRWDIAKILNAFVYLAAGGVLKTKLVKLLFYADFKHFKEHTVSITGLRYAHLPLGPVPDHYEDYLAALLRSGTLNVSEKILGRFTGEEFVGAREADKSVFSATEMKTMDFVAQKFESFTSTKIKDYSHEEAAYRETSPKELISYKYASRLRI